MPLVFVVAGLALIVLVALLAVGRLGALPAEDPDVAPLNLPADRELRADDVVGVRFAVGLRGYRMDQVDVVLERVAVEVREKDARIAALQHQLTGAPDALLAPGGVAAPDPTDPGPAASFPPPGDDGRGQGK